MVHRALSETLLRDTHITALAASSASLVPLRPASFSTWAKKSAIDSRIGVFDGSQPS